MRVRPLLLAVSFVTACRGGAAAPPTQPSGTKTAASPSPWPARVQAEAPRARLVSDVVDRVRALAAARPGGFSVFVRRGSGPGVSEVADALEHALGSSPGVVLARATTTPGGPVADSSTGTGHVNTVDAVVKPPPQLVLLVGLWQARLVVTAEDGHDPLGPPKLEDASWVVLASD